MANIKGMPERVNALGGVEHGDYARIASLCKRPDGTPYSSDYVRKVLKGLRTNKEIEKKSLKYLRAKRRVMAELAI